MSPPAPAAKPIAKTIYYTLIGLVALAVVALGVAVYVATNVLKEKSQEVQDARLRSAVVELNQSNLRKAKADIDKYKELATVAASIVPQDKDQTQTVREIANLAAQNGVEIGSITFPASSLGNANAAPTTPSQLTPVKGIPGVYVLPITVKTDDKVPADFHSFINFLDALEHNRRTALVTGIDLHPALKKPGKLLFTLTLSEFIKP